MVRIGDVHCQQCTWRCAPPGAHVWVTCNARSAHDDVQRQECRNARGDGGKEASDGIQQPAERAYLLVAGHAEASQPVSQLASLPCVQELVKA
eukprot:364187-Chlamydomonas_euryale.AAC.4